MNDVKHILETLGYKLRRDGKGWRAKPIYRPSSNPTSLMIYSNGNFVDFSAGIQGTFPELIALTLKQNLSQAYTFLKSKNFEYKPDESLPKVEVPIRWKKNILDTLIDNQSYLESRGISAETGRIFQGGIVKQDKMSGRYVIPIFKDDYVIGLVGRDITGEQKLKYKKLGATKNFVWPAHINKDLIIEKEEVILVESPMCVLKLYEAGVRHAICLWGIKLSDAILGFLVSAQPKTIIISLNNDGDSNNFVGEKAAKAVYEKLIYFFNPKQVKIIFPYKKDFAESSVSELKNWYKEAQSQLK